MLLSSAPPAVGNNLFVSRRRSIVLMMITATLSPLITGGCATQRDTAGAGTRPAEVIAVAQAGPKVQAIRLEPFTQTIDGTALSFEMIPVNARWVPMIGDRGLQTASGPFWIAKTELTWDLYDTFVFGLDQPEAPDESGVDAITRPSKPYIAMDRGFGKAGYPVISVSYHGARAFCEWLSKKIGRTYRLPTEAEWRVACALGDIRPGAVDDHAWHKDNSDFKTHPVGKKKPGALGLHDMYGNASEWCSGGDDKPVTMGGSYRDSAEEIGCTMRVEPSDTWNASDPQIPKSVWWLADGGFVGFRIVCIPQEDEGANNEQTQ
jgi:formylglycine-generating enzyme required for sulfatase activity